MRSIPARDAAAPSEGQSIQGTESFTYGDIQAGYANWGAASRTNTYTDARGYMTSLLYTLSNVVWGNITSIKLTGPDFSGAPAGTNVLKATYLLDASDVRRITLLPAPSSTVIIAAARYLDTAATCSRRWGGHESMPL